MMNWEKGYERRHPRPQQLQNRGWGKARGPGKAAPGVRWVRGARLGGRDLRPDKVRSGRGRIGLGEGVGPMKESPKAWWGKGREAPRAIGSQNRDRGRGGALATSEVRRDPGRGLSFAELGTRGTRWRRLRRWRMFGPRLGPPKGSRCRGGGVPLQETEGGACGDLALAPALCSPAAAGRSLVPAGALGVSLPEPRHRSFPPDSEESRGPGACGGRSRGCHLDDAALQPRTALSSSF